MRKLLFSLLWIVAGIIVFWAFDLKAGDELIHPSLDLQLYQIGGTVGTLSQWRNVIAMSGMLPLMGVCAWFYEIIDKHFPN